MHNPLFGGPEGATGQLAQLVTFCVTESGKHGERVEHQKAAMVFQPLAWQCLRHPGAKLDFGMAGPAGR